MAVGAVMLPLLQALSGLLWLVPIAQLAPSLARIWRGTASTQDTLRWPLIIAPATGLLGSIYWLFVAPEVAASVTGTDRVFWSCIWGLWCLAALGKAYSLHLSRNLGR